MSSSGFGLIPGANTSGTQISVPYAPQQGGQASVGGNMNPFLPVTTGTSTTIPTMPQGAVSNSATSGMPTSVVGLLPYQGTSGYAPSVPGGASNPTTPPTSHGASKGATGVTGTGNNLGFPTSADGQNKLLQSLNKAYGSGMGTMLYNFLASGAGYNQDAINNLVAGLQPGYEMDQQNLLASFSAGGNRFSSGAQLGESNLMGQEQLNIGQLETQMYEQSVANYIQVMLGAASGSNARKLEAGQATSGLINTVIQGAAQVDAGAAEGAAAACWVAAELYGGWYSPEAVSIRSWLGRTWWVKPFVSLYRKIGKRWAAWIQRNRLGRLFTKQLFDTFLRMASE